MPTTTRLALNKPQSSDIVDVNTAMSNQYTQLDNDAVIQSCTSSTRPSSPYTGKLIYETDTENILKYSGATWEIIQNVNFPRGRDAGMFTSQTTTSSTIAANGLALIMSRTFTAYADRRYAVRAGGGVDMVAGNDASNFVRFRWITGASITTTSGTEFGTFGADCNENTTGGIMRWQATAYFIPDVTGQITVGCIFGRPNNGDAKTVQVREYQWLGIEDIGKQ